MRDAYPFPLLVSWSRKCRAIHLLPLLAVQPLQSLSACTMVHFSFCNVAVETIRLKAVFFHKTLYISHRMLRGSILSLQNTTWLPPFLVKFYEVPSTSHKSYVIPRVSHICGSLCLSRNAMCFLLSIKNSNVDPCVSHKMLWGSL